MSRHNKYIVYVIKTAGAATLTLLASVLHWWRNKNKVSTLNNTETRKAGGYDQFHILMKNIHENTEMLFAHSINDQLWEDGHGQIVLWALLFIIQSCYYSYFFIDSGFLVLVLTQVKQYVCCVRPGSLQTLLLSGPCGSSIQKKPPWNRRTTTVEQKVMLHPRPSVWVCWTFRYKLVWNKSATFFLHRRNVLT